MLEWSVSLLIVAMAGGAVLVARTRRGWVLRAAHGIAGAVGLALLLLAGLRGRVHGAIGVDAAGLVATGFLIGLYLAWLAWRQRRPPGLAVFLHASLGGFGALLVAGIVLG